LKEGGRFPFSISAVPAVPIASWTLRANRHFFNNCEAAFYPGPRKILYLYIGSVYRDAPGASFTLTSILTHQGRGRPGNVFFEAVQDRSTCRNPKAKIR
jgi:hypothetical protein